MDWNFHISLDSVPVNITGYNLVSIGVNETFKLINELFPIKAKDIN